MVSPGLHCDYLGAYCNLSGFWLKRHGEYSTLSSKSPHANIDVGLNEVAIFRKEGSEKRMKKLQNIFDQPNVSLVSCCCQE